MPKSAIPEPISSTTTPEPKNSQPLAVEVEPVGQYDDGIPPLAEVLGREGIPGVTYAYVYPMNVKKLEAEGFRMLPGSEAVEILGEPFLVMTRGLAIGVGGGMSDLMVDTKVDELLA